MKKYFYINRTTIFFITCISIFCVSAASWASCGVCGSDASRPPHKHEIKEEGQEGVAKDPICGMEVKDLKNSPSAEFKGEVYYFCSEQCKKVFNERTGQ
ncbi:copper-transporting P-type ATPase [Candidatus Kuenenia stuttgartiensis]|jgi:YHS domain-containing protein|uniref:Copper-transporting P-type ATPase n=1 Tax=Kuenenia stuttgartiensis TaxID=174633 RepID=Q1Q2X0_KUEST|nr:MULTISPECIES: YHS domain-containing protein [Kuenenia]MBE7548473.1 YHS domain-containing protein [Planctomycetia bacterium]MBW7942537.1 YHS domain-containing protein [Candidatus Kuenenia stuttgartiensis]MBZ0190574.1 YHS domain-containing protein [Candidatus Kuenenia stuttgartiensis]MCF6151680.1 YHS domain-containing protein [Candidatus Kuenenia stuttgartiensis]MCL4728376.1 YHS domain-containing protein [Candidatus Kuenenia stuttgartiensis]